MNPRTITLLISIGINALLLILLGKGCNNPCPEGVIVKHYTDTVYRDIRTVLPTITVKVPEAYRTITTHHILRASDIGHPTNSLSPGPAKALESVSAVGGATSNGFSNPQPFTGVPNAEELAIYSDTTEEPNQYKAIILDSLQQNRIIGRRITFWNLSPIITEHIEKTTPLKEGIRVYLGVSAGFEASYTQKRISNFNIGPEVLITEPHGALLGYSYDAKNNGHRISFAWKIKIKK